MCRALEMVPTEGVCVGGAVESALCGFQDGTEVELTVGRLVG